METTVGSVASYTCATGSENMKGPEERVCKGDGTWSEYAPSCEEKDDSSEDDGKL